jgi:membrane-bound inhibitor of C-type lysozyme
MIEIAFRDFLQGLESANKTPFLLRVLPASGVRYSSGRCQDLTMALPGKQIVLLQAISQSIAYKN